jgi:tRNA A-37 threonylcarbamoyl transferase component Bud32
MTDWQVSGFEEVRELGRGGQGRVVLARHTTRGTPVAIKYLPADADPEAQERFRHEARMLGQVDNPHVARLFRLVESEHGVAIIMEAVEGVSFKEILGRYGKLEPEAALTVLKGSLLGLAAAHAVGVVHRDYKPANVVVPADGRSKLIDFGIATRAGTSSAAGTPLYMAPEQWRGEPASPATDVYAATCVFYESVTGHRPFPPGDRAALRQSHLSDPVPLDDLPEALRPLVTRGMAKDAAERPAGASAFVGELEEIAQGTYGPDWETRGVRALAGAAVTMAALFPLAAAGLAPTTAAATGAATGAGTAAGTGGVLTTLGTKTIAIIAGTAVIGVTAGGYGAYQATRPEPKHRTAVTTATPTGVPITLSAFKIFAPAGWTARHLPGGGQNYRVNLSAACKPPSGAPDYGYNNSCPSFAVLDRRGLGWDDPVQLESRYRPGRVYIPANDTGHVCPPAPAKYHGAAEPKLVRKGTAKVGGHAAGYYEWRLTCLVENAVGGLKPTGITFVQKTWFLPQSTLLIIDEWNTPGLDKILEQAQWL